MADILKTYGLSKTYGRNRVVNQVNMTVKKGDIYGFIGRNGAGKTTFMKTVLGIALPSSGNYEFFGGMDPDQARHKVGALIETPNLFKNCTAMENLKRFTILNGNGKSQEKELLDLVGLSNVQNKKAGAFSLGMRQRLGIAAALIGEPEFLILDEPVNGLDPAGIVEVRDLIIRLNRERGITVLISSHLLDELAKVATVFGIIDNGELLEEIRSEDLATRFRQQLRIRVNDIPKAMAVLTEQIPANEIAVEGQELVLSSHSDESGRLNRLLVTHDVEVTGLNRISENLEHYFIERVGH